MLDGKEVDGYILRISEVVEGTESDEIKGTMTGIPDRDRPVIPFFILANESDLDSPKKIEQLIFQIEDEIDQKRSSVRIDYTSGL
jgi:hypothetical protein